MLRRVRTLPGGKRWEGYYYDGRDEAGNRKEIPLGTDLNEAKALFFDRKYEESRAKWAEIALAPGPNSEAASYWIARCSESLGETERAFREYGVFLDLPPTDTRLAEEAEISRVGLATKLTRAGKPGFLTAVIRSLGDDRAPVRYFGALQVGSLPNLVDALVDVQRPRLGGEIHNVCFLCAHASSIPRDRRAAYASPMSSSLTYCFTSQSAHGKPSRIYRHIIGKGP